MTTGSGATTINGVVRFDLASSTAQRFGSGIDNSDLTLGWDGHLYTLESSGGTGFKVREYDPVSLNLMNTITTTAGSGLRGIAVNSSGDIFAADWSGMLYHFNSQGALLKSLSVGNSAGDIDLASDGTIIVGITDGGNPILTDETLSSYHALNVGGGASFVAFTEPVPEPGTLGLGVLALLTGVFVFRLRNT